MRLRFLFPSVVSIVLLAQPATANQKFLVAQQNPFDQNNDSITKPKAFELPELPKKEVVPQPLDNGKFAGVVTLGKQMIELDAQVQALMARYKSLKPGMFFLDLETGDYLDINGDSSFAAASTIKYPILIALFQEIDAGRVRLDETLVMQRKQMTGGSGNMQYRKVGTRFSLLETATRMMTISDNTATNMIIDRLGGQQLLNERFRSWGLQNTVIRNMLGDFNGTNTTSAKDLVRLSALIENQQLVSEVSHNQILNIMLGCTNRKLLPAGLGSGASIAHKTGTLRFVLGDAGIIKMPTGKRYLAGIFVKRPNHDPKARAFIQKVSRLVYNYLEQPKLTALNWE